MKTEKSVLPYRWALILFCASVAGTCLYTVNRGYDPLARYPYADETQRETILAYMDQEDIDYLINQQLQPGVFMEFLTLPEFDVHNALWYRQAMDTQNEDPEVVVHFINRYRDVLPLKDLETLLRHYSYAQLADWYEQPHEDVTLIPDPTQMFAMPGAHASVWTYIPADLTRQGNVYLKPEAATSLTEMLEEYHRVMDEDKVEAETGYLRFDEAQSLYLDVNNDLLVYPAGQNEQQLGWTAALTGHAAWMSAMKTLLSDPAFTGTPVEAARNVYDGLSEQEQERIQWLQDNAWRYGFIIRWPETGQESTGHVWQPFMIRYVGQEKARDLHAADRTLEESQ